MNDFDNVIVPYWLVKLGNLFYVGGLKRKTREYAEAVSYELTNEESLAFPILIEDIALKLAEKLGGIAVRKELASKELAILQHKNEVYSNSENSWEKEQNDYINKLLKDDI